MEVVEYGRPPWEVPSSLTPAGRPADVADRVANGLHSATLCGG